jgi:7,8-dihydropterin-6-yl-methyl-4-(beta-D-ribofuranosyl)aminobenzene 5'-phosphate synthase
MKNKKIHAVIGGFHLLNASEERIMLTVNDLASLNLANIYPCHCTGKKAVSALKSTFGSRLKTVGTGDVVEL